MMQSKSGFDEKMVRNATWGAIFLTAAGLAFFGFAVSTVNFHDWQDYILVGFPLILAAMSLASIYIMWRGHAAFGTGIVLALNLMLPVILSAIVRDTLWSALSYAIVSSALLIWRALPRHSWRWPIIATIATLIAIVMLQIVAPPGQFNNPPALNTFIVVLILLLSVAFVIQAVRQTWGRSIRNKLMASFIGVTLIATITLAVYVYISTNSILQQSLKNELTQHTLGVADQISALFNEQVSTVTTLSLNKVLQQTVENINTTYKGDASAIQDTLKGRDAQWRLADAADNNFAPLVHDNLSNQAALELKEFQNSFPNNVEVFITDKYGGLAGTTNRTSDYYQADEDWWQAAYNNGQGAIYISAPEYDESADALAVLIALPIRNRENGEIIGILRTTYLASTLNPILAEQVGKTGETDLFIPGEKVFHYNGEQYTQFDTDTFNQIQAAGQRMLQMNYEDNPSVVLQFPVQTAAGNPVINKLGWIVVYHQHQDEALAPVNAQTRGALIVMAMVLFLAVAAAIGLSVFLVRPIAQLTQTAEEVAAGNLNSRAKVNSTDEVGILASTFNSMASQLQETLEALEQRVAARTKDLAIVAEVGTATATILESKRLLQEVVELTKERFNLYHSHIYLLDEEGKNLVLTAGAGEPGRNMVSEGRSIPLSREQSLVARAARESKGVTVNDVTQAPDFLPNPLLPDTHSELAVPMIVGGKVIGVFDIQSEQVGRFTESDVNIQTTLAAQLAVSIQNVRSFEQSRKQAELEVMVNTIGQRIQRTTSIEETLQTAIRELGTALGASRVKANISTRKDGSNN